MVYAKKAKSSSARPAKTNDFDEFETLYDNHILNRQERNSKCTRNMKHFSHKKNTNKLNEAIKGAKRKRKIEIEKKAKNIFKPVQYNRVLTRNFGW